MLNFLKGKPTFEFLSPMTGEVGPVTECPDPVFSGKLLGDGIVIRPTEGTVYAPVDGTIIQISHTLHAFCIQADDGLEILTHLGLDTVKLDGKGFTCHVQLGQHVAKGDKVLEMDLDFIKLQGIRVDSPCIITNLDIVKSMEVKPGPVIGGKTAAITYKL